MDIKALERIRDGLEQAMETMKDLQVIGQLSDDEAGDALFSLVANANTEVSTLIREVAEEEAREFGVQTLNNIEGLIDEEDRDELTGFGELPELVSSPIPYGEEQ